MNDVFRVHEAFYFFQPASIPRLPPEVLAFLASTGPKPKNWRGYTARKAGISKVFDRILNLPVNIPPLPVLLARHEKYRVAVAFGGPEGTDV